MVAMLPKDGTAAPDDRRPLTIMSITYRMWAKRHARHINDWLATWKPQGLSGAAKHHSCTDVLWQVQMELCKARTGKRGAAYILSLDLAKCFDRLDLEPLGLDPFVFGAFGFGAFWVWTLLGF